MPKQIRDFKIFGLHIMTQAALEKRIEAVKSAERATTHRQLSSLLYDGAVLQAANDEMRQRVKNWR